MSLSRAEEHVIEEQADKHPLWVKEGLTTPGYFRRGGVGEKSRKVTELSHHEFGRGLMKLSRLAGITMQMLNDGLGI